jgi:hypothetical protein
MIMAVRVLFGRSVDLADVLARFLKDVAIAVLVVRFRFFGPIFPLDKNRNSPVSSVAAKDDGRIVPQSAQKALRKT